ncbi:DNA gyrase subunit B [Devosia pacifica]|nr:DNA gyrase subunit B [Devosia pacifica]
MASNPEKDEAAARFAEAKGDIDERKLEVQVAQLQEDLRGIADTLKHLTGERVSGAQRSASAEFRNFQRRATNSINDTIEDIEDQASELELELKDRIREKPFASVFAALGIGYLLALISRH